MGWQELVILAVVVLIFVKPAEIPDLLYKAGRIARQLKDFISSVQMDVEQTRHNINILKEEKSQVDSSNEVEKNQ